MMNRVSQETLRRVEENDETMTELYIGDYGGVGELNSANGDDYSRLGTFIGENTHLRTLTVTEYERQALKNTNAEFFDGLIHNTSISVLHLDCCIALGRGNIVGGVAHEILKAYQENNTNLTRLYINNADLQNGGDQIVAATLRSCTNLRYVCLRYCSIIDEQLLPLVDSIRGSSSLEILNLNGNRIGRAGCTTIATLLDEPSCNIQQLYVIDNRINDEGATILANSLVNNTNLRELWLYNNPIDASVHDIFSRLLCNTTSINDTYSSNHTLERLSLAQYGWEQLEPLLQLNKGTNKSHVAIKKILKYHPNIDMEPLFEWNMEGEGERDLKALPYVVAWFERAVEAVAGEEGANYNIAKQKLSAMYQFAKAMPLMFVPTSQNKEGGGERKRDDN